MMEQRFSAHCNRMNLKKWPHLSAGSLGMLNKMLQVDAKRRITLKELLTDPWMMEGYEGRPVKWQSKYHSTGEGTKAFSLGWANLIES